MTIPEGVVYPYSHSECADLVSNIDFNGSQPINIAKNYVLHPKLFRKGPVDIIQILPNKGASAWFYMDDLEILNGYSCPEDQRPSLKSNDPNLSNIGLIS